MIARWTAMAAVMVALAAMVLILKLIQRLFHPHPELVRKLLHVGMGLVVLTLPWLFDRAWPVLLLTGVAAAALAVVKLSPRWRDGIGTVVTAVHRATLGEVCFPIAVAALFLLSRGDKLLFCVPMLIMTLADAVAALIGVTYGRLHYITSDGLKSAEGSIAFFAIAFLSVHVPLLLFTDVRRPQTLLIACIIGLLSMLLEAIAWRGLDNLLIPLGAFAFLRLYLHASPQALILRLLATLLLLAFALAWRRRSSLDDSALMASAIFGYGAWMLGGTAWLIAPALLFLIHVILWPSTNQRRQHTVWAVAAAVGAGLLWLALHAASGAEHFLYPYAIAFGTQLALIGIAHTAGPVPVRARRGLARWILAGCALFAIQMLPLLKWAPSTHSADAMLLATAGFGAVAVGALLFFRLLPLLDRRRRSDLLIHSAQFAIAIASSLGPTALLYGPWAAGNT